MHPQPALVTPASAVWSFHRLAEPTRNVRGVPVEAQRAAPINFGFRETASAEGENPARAVTHLATPFVRLEHGGFEAHRRREAVAPNIETEPHAAHANEVAVATATNQREEFIHAQSLTDKTKQTRIIFIILIYFILDKMNVLW